MRVVLLYLERLLQQQENESGGKEYKDGIEFENEMRLAALNSKNMIAKRALNAATIQSTKSQHVTNR